MTAVNGHVEEVRQSATPSLHLGKRKRSLSSEKAALPSVNGSTDTIQNLVRDLKGHDFASKILLHPATTRSADIPAAKKLRSDPDQHTIEARLAEDSYSNLDDLLLDLKHAATQLSSDTSSTAPATTDDKLSKSQSVQLEQLISRYSDAKSSTKAQPSSSMLDNRNQVLSVRSSVEGGSIRQLFTGLRLKPAAPSTLQEIDATKLPNGFDVIEAATLHPSRKPQPVEKRTFGAVFGPQRNLRQLETPKYSRGARGTELDFEKPYENLAVSNKQDYRYAQLNAGLSLSYASTKQETGKPPASRDPAISASSDALFAAAYSSFAPSQDREYAVVSQSDKSRQYWRRYGSDAWASKSTHSSAAGGTSVVYPDPDLQDFDAVIAEYVAPDTEEDKSRAFMIDESPEDTASKEVDEIMEEVAELLQTLSSYQRIRDLDRNAVTGAAVKPNTTEQETFELLCSQLKLLVDSLPPFAVAKLDGSQLNALNVNTTIPIDSPDVTGTGQLDDYTLRRTRAHVQQQAVANRSNSQSQMQTRPYGSNQTPAASYNTQNRPTYNANSSTPSVPGYASRGPNAGFYNTPRPNPTPAYNGQTATFRQQAPYPNATIQQYQRSLQNGYAQSMSASQSYTQRPNSYLSNLQGQSATPSKPPVMNGQTFAASAQQAVRPPYTPSPATNTWSGASAQATIKAQQQLQQQREQAQAQANASEAQRQASNTPQPDGSVDDNTIHVATNGKSATPAPASATATPATAST